MGEACLKTRRPFRVAPAMSTVRRGKSCKTPPRCGTYTHASSDHVVSQCITTQRVPVSIVGRFRLRFRDCFPKQLSMRTSGTESSRAKPSTTSLFIRVPRTTPLNNQWRGYSAEFALSPELTWRFLSATRETTSSRGGPGPQPSSPTPTPAASGRSCARSRTRRSRRPCHPLPR